jgi:hypothetical protein
MLSLTIAGQPTGMRLTKCLFLPLQAAQLLCSFREYHRRASFGLSGYYGQKLAAFEVVLLNAREALFSAQQGPEQLQEDQQLKVSRSHCVHCINSSDCCSRLVTCAVQR